MTPCPLCGRDDCVCGPNGPRGTTTRPELAALERIAARLRGMRDAAEQLREREARLGARDQASFWRGAASMAGDALSLVETFIEADTVDAQDATWAFVDMHSGGGTRLDAEVIFLRAPDEASARATFTRLTGCDPEHVTCECCGPDFAVHRYDPANAEWPFERPEDPKTKTLAKEARHGE